MSRQYRRVLVSVTPEPTSTGPASRRALPWQAIVAATVLATIAAIAVLLIAASGNDDPAPVGAGADDDTPSLTLSDPVDPDADPLDVAYTDPDEARTTGTLRDRLDGRPLVVNFFASWCTPCIAELPDFQTVSQELEGTVDFFGLAVQDRPEDATGIVRETGVTFPWSRDIRGDVIAAAGIVQMPSTMLIGPDGTVLDIHPGAMDADDLRDWLDENLGASAG